MSQVFFDRFAIILSGICAIHCILLPIFISAVPMLMLGLESSNLVHEFVFHQAILIFVLPVSLIALFMGWRAHRQVAPISIACLGLFILVTVALFADQFILANQLPHESETVLTMLGGGIHALGHIMNVLATRKLHNQFA